MGSTSKKINGVAKKECMRGKVGWKTQGLQTQKVKIAPKHTKYSEENTGNVTQIKQSREA